MITERLKELRGKRTQGDVAEKIKGLTREKLSHYETGRTEPDIEMLHKLSDFYNVTVDYLTGRSGKPHLTERQERELSLEAIIEFRDKLRRGERGDIPEARANFIERFLSLEIEQIETELNAQK
jgi:transcriptional regulator with XRE-family HTH domain